MCGIAGSAWSDPTFQADPQYIERITNRLSHRGPDGFGSINLPGCTLGHRRLSIIDISTGQQPIANEDESIWVTFNGEIYNFQPIREQLLKLGHSFKTKSDTEVLVHLYEQFGVEMVHHLRGMFAFAIWDIPKQQLLLVRDRLGVKPLVYWHDQRGIRFASELKSFTLESDFPRDLDWSAIDDYLTYQYVPHPKTIFASARKLPPAHYALFSKGDLTVKRYWHPPFEQEAPARDERAWMEELDQTMAEATRLRMISDVPIGAFLSGGIDSTIVAGLMQSMSQTPIRTFAIGFPVKAFDERAFAQAAADFLHTQHQEFVVEPKALDVIDTLSWHYDEPFADSSAIPTYYVSKVCRAQVKVALTGDAGDEMFGGYDRYLAAKVGAITDRMPGPVRWLITNPLWQSVPTSTHQKSYARRAKKLLKHLGEPQERRYRQHLCIFDDALRPQLYTSDFVNKLAGHDASRWIFDLYGKFPQRDFLTRTMAVDIESYLPCDILTKVDIASMAVGLECRSPFLDHKLAELSARMPADLKIRNAQTKSILKSTFARYLPDSIKRRGKMGFGVPLAEWFRGELKGELTRTLNPERLTQRGWFNPQSVQQLVSDHLANRWDHSARLWALVMLERWAEKYLDR